MIITLCVLYDWFYMSLTLMHVYIIINKDRSQRNKMRMRGIDLSELFSGFHPGEIWSVEKGWLYIFSNALLRGLSPYYKSDGG